jgi:hypothetical protein
MGAFGMPTQVLPTVLASANCPTYAPSSIWWVITYLITPAIDAVNVTFVVLQDRSFLLVQQE